MTKVNLDKAAASFALANTPIFLAVRLRQDEGVRLASQLPSSEILKDLRRAIKAKPNTFEKAVLPYFYLAALAEKQDGASLKKAATYTAPHSMWYLDIANFLIKDLRPTVYASSQAASHPWIKPNSNSSSQTPTTVRSLKVSAA